MANGCIYPRHGVWRRDRGSDGATILLTTPDDWDFDRGDFNHKGCVVLDVESLERPSLRRNPACAAGILFTRRSKDAEGLNAEIWSPLLRP